jgi:hypothetical protein
MPGYPGRKVGDSAWRGHCPQESGGLPHLRQGAYALLEEWGNQAALHTPAPGSLVAPSRDKILGSDLGATV